MMSDTDRSAGQPEQNELRDSYHPASGALATDGRNRIRLVVVMAAGTLIAGGAVALSVFGRGDQADHGKDEQVTKLGVIEVTARLTEIRGDFLPNDGLYNYVFVMMYEITQVHRGKAHADRIAVAHYNPLKQRADVADEFYSDLGGRLKKFRAGDTHRMALEVPLDDHYMGGIIDRYFDEDKGPLYWAVWTNLVE